jgi:dihydroflavonol-4-reductase
MNVLVTGGGGFIGSHLVEDQLKKGRTVKALDLGFPFLNGAAEDAKVRKIVGDIRNRDLVGQSLEGVDLVFHLASAHLSLAIAEQEYWDVNVHAAEQLVRLSQIAGVKRFVHCSTVGVYGNVTQCPGNEESRYNPDLVYEKTKLAGEQAVLRASQESGYPVSIVRPVWVYGPRCPRTAKLFRAIRKGTFVMVGSGRTLRHCVYISDMIDGFDLCAQRGAAIDHSFIIGDESAVTIQHLVDEIAAVVKAPSPRLKIPVRMIAPACAIFEAGFKAIGKEPPLSTRSLKFFTNNTTFDISKAKTLLDFVPKVSLRDGLERTYEYLLRHGQIN